MSSVDANGVPVVVGSDCKSDSSCQAAPEVVGSGRSRLRTLNGVQILATGSYIPEKVVRNEDLVELGCDPEWIVQRSGIHERRHAAEDVSTGDLVYEAAKSCIEQAGVDAKDIDLLVVATITPDRRLPSTACEMQERLGLVSPAMDVTAACAGFMYGAVTAMQYVKTGSSQLALVVAGDTLTKVINKKDKKTYPLFGDGAGAVLLGQGEPSQGFLAYTLGSEGNGADYLSIKAGGSRCPITVEAVEQGEHLVHMDGRPVFKWAVRLLADTIKDVLLKAQLTMDDIDLVVLHQANTRIIDAAVDDIGIDRKKLVGNLERCGNTSGASIAIVLDEANRQGRIQRGDRVLLCGFGAGLSWGTAVLQW